MNKKIMKILICTLILLIGINVVNAIEYNNTDELMSFDNDASSVCVDDEVLSVDDNLEDSLSVSQDEVINAEINESDLSSSKSEDVLSAEDANEVLSSKNNNSDTLSYGNDNNVLSAKVNDTAIMGSSTGKISFCPPDDMSGNTVIQEYEHTFFKIKFPKKYWKYIKMDYKKTPKKFKKWAKKVFLKKLKKSVKKLKKKVKVNKKYHWELYRIKYFKYGIGSRYCLELYALFHRTYYYDSNLEKFCWK